MSYKLGDQYVILKELYSQNGLPNISWGTVISIVHVYADSTFDDDLSYVRGMTISGRSVSLTFTQMKDNTLVKSFVSQGLSKPMAQPLTTRQTPTCSYHVGDKFELQKSYGIVTKGNILRIVSVDNTLGMAVLDVRGITITLTFSELQDQTLVLPLATPGGGTSQHPLQVGDEYEAQVDMYAGGGLRIPKGTTFTISDIDYINSRVELKNSQCSLPCFNFSAIQDPTRFKKVLTPLQILHAAMQVQPQQPSPSVPTNYVGQGNMNGWVAYKDEGGKDSTVVGEYSFELKKNKCTCGACKTFGENYPVEYHSDWCDLRSQK